MKNLKEVLSYLNEHRAKIAVVLSALAAFWTVHQHDLTSGDKNRVVAAIVSGLVMYLRGNSNYETVKMQIEADSRK